MFTMLCVWRSPRTHRVRRPPRATCLCVLSVLCVLPSTRLLGAGPRIATIEFFGHKGIDTAAIRAALPFHEGDEVSSGEEAKARVREAVVLSTGKEVTDVAGVCCASDGGLLPFAIDRDSFALWPAKRREFIVDLLCADLLSADLCDREESFPVWEMLCLGPCCESVEWRGPWEGA